MPELPIKVTATVGERSVDKLVDAVIDAFSPATETLGFLGDAVRLARVEVAAAVTRRAKAIADANGLKLAAPPLKFLVPYYEKASTEDATDDQLVEMWAQLLASAGTAYDARQIRFASILSELSAEQARILDCTARNFNGVLGQHYDELQLFFNFTEARLRAELCVIKASDSVEVLQGVFDVIAVPGVSIVIIMWDHFDWSSDQVYKDQYSLDFEILRSLGLLERVSIDDIQLEHVEIRSVSLYHVTELGFEFWRSCNGRPHFSKIEKLPPYPAKIER